ncbi:hypothetical protein PVK06_001664 [Gossypium arboreum]|uniref:Uncharacterized protein n=1 Tax=Gossypium arboreum TaxID=29729 RepID=A0ABR0R1T2_GOSAR|nr:hypothetical protein PVK06_001664 [Gossypium arboreum]
MAEIENSERSNIDWPPPKLVPKPPRLLRGGKSSSKSRLREELLVHSYKLLQSNPRILIKANLL